MRFEDERGPVSALDAGDDILAPGEHRLDLVVYPAAPPEVRDEFHHAAFTVRLIKPLVDAAGDAGRCDHFSEQPYDLAHPHHPLRATQWPDIPFAGCGDLAFAVVGRPAYTRDAAPAVALSRRRGRLNGRHEVSGVKPARVMAVGRFSPRDEAALEPASGAICRELPQPRHPQRHSMPEKHACRARPATTARDRARPLWRTARSQ